MIDGPSFSLGLALALPIYLFVDRRIVPWLVDVVQPWLVVAVTRRHGRA